MVWVKLSFLLVLTVASLTLCHAQATRNFQTYIVTENQKAFEYLFGKERTLATVPFCYQVPASRPGEFSTQQSNMSWADYSTMLREKRQAAIEVSLYVKVLQLIDVSEKEQSLNMVLETATTWKDCRLHWTRDVSTADTLRLNPYTYRKLEIFAPPVRLLEALTPQEGGDSEMQIEIRSSGRIFVSRDFSIQLSCDIDVTMYPFDIQSCSLTFESVMDETIVNMTYQWQGTVEQASLYTLGRYMPSDQWELVVLPPYKKFRKTCFTDDDQGDEMRCTNDALLYPIYLRRHPDYELINLLFPAFLIVIISSFVFIIPPDSGDKMALSMSILLSLYMFSSLMYDKMPETGSTIPLLSQYFLVCIGLVTTSCLYSAFSAVLSEARPKVPYCLRKFVLLMGPYLIFDMITHEHCRATLVHETRQRRQTKGKKQNPQSDQAIELSRSDRDLSQALNNNNNNKNVHAQGGGFCLDPVEITWKVFGALLDRCFFVLHFCACIFVLVYFLVYGYLPWTGYESMGLTGNAREYMCAQLRLQNDSHVEEYCTD